MSISNLVSLNQRLQNKARSLKEWLDWQESLHFTAIELGLDRCRRVADAMGLLPPNYYVISIAGTNGKGSCAALLELILRESGYSTGLYISPHLTRYNERIKINGQEQTDDILCDSFSRINQSRGEISLTYFEFGTIAAMDIFARNQIDIAIMEVGMGGRLDAVNMLDANVALVSTIDFDHEQWLGNTRDAIGREKAGIFRSMRPAICGDPDPPSTINEIAELVGANLLQADKDFHIDLQDHCWSWRSGKARYHNLPIPGNMEYQVQNAATVLMSLESISDQYPVSQEAILNGLKNFAIPGRFQVIVGEPTRVLDVAHNAQSALMLRKNIDKYLDKKRVIMIVAMLEDKDHAKFLSELTPCADILCLAGLEGGRGASAEELEEVAKTVGVDTEVMVFGKLADALSWSETNSLPDDVMVITGSFITVGMAIEFFNIETTDWKDILKKD